MEGKVVIVTGANSGIGKVTARELARQGATVVLGCRNEGRGTAARDELRRDTGRTDIELLLVDLASEASIRDFAQEVLSRYDRLDVLVNNAGVYLPKRQTTMDGFEATFGINHLGTFLLTHLLLDRLKTTAPSRVVTLSSAGHMGGRIDFDDLMAERRYVPMRVYCNSKLANLLFARELARRLDGTGVTSNAVHPGAVGTEFAQDEPGLFNMAMKAFKPFILTPEKGARTTIHAASSPAVEGVTGEYFSRSKVARSSRTGRDMALAGRLWDVSLGLWDLPAQV